jgi:hypothetical protein
MRRFLSFHSIQMQAALAACGRNSCDGAESEETRFSSRRTLAGLNFGFESQSMTPAEGRKDLARVAIFVAAVAAVALPVGFEAGRAFTRVDSEWYLLIAQGNTAATMHPFAARQLGPLIVRGLSSLTHTSLLACFLFLGVVSLLTAASICGWLLIRQGARWPQLLAVGGTFFWSATFGAFMLPDTFAAALLSLFLLLLWKRQYTWAALLLLPMFVSRESTILVLICFLAAGWRTLSWLQRGVAVLASLIGTYIVRVLMTHSLPNREQINPLLYLVGKVPWNFSSNVMAVGPWMPTFNNFCVTPKWTVHLPWGLHLGASYAVGVCGYQPTWHPRLILIALCSFGLLPVFTLFLWRYHRALLWGPGLYLRFCMAYGTVAYFMAPLLGRTIERLFLYSWPLFLLITPLAAARAFHGKPVPWKLLFVLHLATAWADWLLFDWWEQVSIFRAWGLCAVIIAVNVVAWQLLWRADSQPAHVRQEQALEMA